MRNARLHGKQRAGPHVNYVAAFMLGLMFVLGQVKAQSADPIYKGKQIRLVIGSGAGGGYDVYARTLAPYLAKHIPGNPTVITQNMEGAAGLTATNWGFRRASRDGTVVLALANAVLLERLFGNTAADYETLAFAWVGSIARQQNICMTWHTSPIKTIEEAREREVIVSATGVTGGPAAWPKVVNALLGTKFKVIGG